MGLLDEALDRIRQAQTGLTSAADNESKNLAEQLGITQDEAQELLATRLAKAPTNPEPKDDPPDDRHWATRNLFGGGKPKDE